MACFQVNKTFYPKVALVKAAHRFLTDYFLFIEAYENNYIISWESKKDNFIDDNKFELDFKNELLTQLIRYEVFQQTKTIRQLTLARAFASSMYTTSHAEEDGIDCSDNIFDIDAVLSEWSSNDNG